MDDPSAEPWDGRGPRAKVLRRNPDTRLRASGELRALAWSSLEDELEWCPLRTAAVSY